MKIIPDPINGEQMKRTLEKAPKAEKNIEQNII